MTFYDTMLKDVLAFIESAGVEKNDAPLVLSQACQLSAAGGGTVWYCARSLVTILNVYTADRCTLSENETCQ